MSDPDPEAVPIEVRVHVHFVMAGTFPLRVADLLFTPTELVIPEYEYLTPLFGLARGGASTASERAKRRYREDGPAGLLELAEKTHRIPYTDVECIRVYESRISRPKVAVALGDRRPYAYRIHAPVDLAELTSALRSLGERRGFDVERRSGIGFSPLNSVRRFFADR